MEEKGFYLNEKVVEFLKLRYEGIWQLIEDLIDLTKENEF